MAPSNPESGQIAAIRAIVERLVSEQDYQRGERHKKNEIDSAFREVMVRDMALVKNGLGELIDNTRSYQKECTAERDALEERVAGMEGLKKYLFYTAIIAGSVVTAITHIAQALVR